MEMYSSQSDSVTITATKVERLKALNKTIAKCELFFSAFFLAIVFILLVVNVSTRAVSASIYWIDEAAIMAMIWMAFFAAAAAIHNRSNISVTLINDILPAGASQYLRALVDFVMLVFFLVLTILCWNWFDPIYLYRSGWDLTKFSMSTFNFIYEEPTMTLGIKKFWFWLIMPIFAVLSLLHSVINLSESVLIIFKRGDKK